MPSQSDSLLKGVDDWGQPIRYMTSEEIKERENLNIANTASSIRRRVVAELAKMNGGNEHSTPI